MPLLQCSRVPKFTIFGRSLLIITLELFANALFWIVAGILFGRSDDSRPILNLALLAWTLGLRHALDADHIRSAESQLVYGVVSLIKYNPPSAIDNATRGLINMGQLPVTCGLYFSLGHSTIVIIVNVAIAISTDIYDKLGNVGSVGSIVGAAVSGCFLFIVGVANSIILYRILKQRRNDRMRVNQAESVGGGEAPSVNNAGLRPRHHGNTLLMRIIGPVITLVDRPWKMYPLGVLFGFGFDTASSIAILAISAIAKRGSDGKGIKPAQVMILPLLFTSGMMLIDSLDSILMLYAYTGFPEHKFALFAKRGESNPPGDTPHEPELNEDRPEQINMRAKMNAMSGLSIILTLMSILVAFSISLITIMGLVGEQCTPCREAAEDEENHSLAARWWRGWVLANEKSPYIGAAIVGSFLAVVLGWYGIRWVLQMQTSRAQRRPNLV